VELPSPWDKDPDFSFLPVYTDVEREAISRAVELATVGLTKTGWPREVVSVLQVLAAYGYEYIDANDVLKYLKLIPPRLNLPYYVWSYVLSNPAVQKSRLIIVQDKLSNTNLNPIRRIHKLSKLMDEAMDVYESYKDSQRSQKPRRDDDEDDVSDDDTSPIEAMGKSQVIQNQVGLVLKLSSQLALEQKALRDWVMDAAKDAPKLGEISVTEQIGHASQQATIMQPAIAPKEDEKDQASTLEIVDKSRVVSILQKLIDDEKKRGAMSNGEG
jgi:hypothetical protein